MARCGRPKPISPSSIAQQVSAAAGEVLMENTPRRMDPTSFKAFVDAISGPAMPDPGRAAGLKPRAPRLPNRFAPTIASDDSPAES
jgi:hypothetical protein